MNGYTWESNPEWEDLPSPEQGDKVHFKMTDTFRYLVETTVISTKENMVTVVVNKVFDLDNFILIKGGDILDLVGEEISLKKRFMQDVLK